MRMVDDLDEQDGVDVDGDVDMEWDGDNEVKEDEHEEDEEVEDVDEDDGKETWTIGQGEMVNLPADNVDAIVDDEPIVLPAQCQEIG
jgi:hypothetical protein